MATDSTKSKSGYPAVVEARLAHTLVTSIVPNFHELHPRESGPRHGSRPMDWSLPSILILPLIDRSPIGLPTSFGIIPRDLIFMPTGLPTPIIGIHGVPRSGTSWLGQIFNSSEYVAYRYQPIFSHTFKGRINEISSRTTMERFFADLLVTEDDFVLQRGSARLARKRLRLSKESPTHLVYKEVRYHNLIGRILESGLSYRVIAIMRNPVDVIASWHEAPREFRRDWDLRDEWRKAPGKNAGQPEEFYGFDGWKRAADIFEDLAGRYRDKVKIVTYESLVSDPENLATELFEFADLPLTRQVCDFIRKSTSFDDLDPYGHHRPRGYKSSKRERLPPEIVREIHRDLKQTRLEKYLEI